MSAKPLFRWVGDVEVVEFDKSKIPYLGSKLDTAEVINNAFEHARAMAARSNYRPKILFDFRNVRAITPVAVNQLEEQARLTESIGGEVRLLNIHHVKSAQAASQLARILPVHYDEAEAVRSFA